MEPCYYVLKKGVMWFGIDEDRAGKILSALSKASVNKNLTLLDEVKVKANSLSKSGNINDKIRGLMFYNYEYVGDFEYMHLFVKAVHNCTDTFEFRYITKKWPDKNGTNPIIVSIKE